MDNLFAENKDDICKNKHVFLKSVFFILTSKICKISQLSQMEAINRVV